MPASMPVFLLGLGLGTGLLAVGLLLGYWLGKRAVPGVDIVDRKQFLMFLRNLSHWTSEFAGDVSKYQSQLTNLSQQAHQEPGSSRTDIQKLISQIMNANRQLQERLDTAEQRLESQTNQIASYLTEARTDGLTGLANRRAFDQTLDDLFLKWQSKGQAFSLGLIDIDHFKKINDTYGHPAGDAVLKKVAETLQAELRDVVCVARYGGEEFAVLSLSSADVTASDLDSLRMAIQKIEVVHDEKVIRVSLSAGAGQIAADDKIGKLVRRSDEALYAAKLGGRNRVYLHDGTMCRLVTKIAPNPPIPSASTPQNAPIGTEMESKDQVQQRLQERLKRIVEEESRRVAEVSQQRS